MGNMSIRNIPDRAYAALKTRAAQNGRSAEAEVRAMIVEIANTEEFGGFGTRLSRCFDGVEGDDLSFERDRTPAEPITLE
ncbi:MAG: plasmid stability protein [Pseudomonadota bacterium]